MYNCCGLFKKVFFSSQHAYCSSCTWLLFKNHLSFALVGLMQKVKSKTCQSLLIFLIHKYDLVADITCSCNACDSPAESPNLSQIS